MKAIFWSALTMAAVLALTKLAIAFIRGCEREDEAVTLVQTDCCHEYKGVEDVLEYAPLRFVCAHPAMCKSPKAVRIQK